MGFSDTLATIGRDLQGVGGAVSSLPKNDATPGVAPGSPDSSTSSFSLDGFGAALSKIGGFLTGFGKSSTLAPPSVSNNAAVAVPARDWTMPLLIGGGLLLTLALVKSRR